MELAGKKQYSLYLTDDNHQRMEQYRSNKKNVFVFNKIFDCIK